MNPAVKPGWQTTQFWSHVAIGLAIALLTMVMEMQDQLPPTIKAIVALGGTAALAWLHTAYNSGRTQLYAGAQQLAIAAGAAAAKDVTPGASGVPANSALNKVVLFLLLFGALILPRVVHAQALDAGYNCAAGDAPIAVDGGYLITVAEERRLTCLLTATEKERDELRAAGPDTSWVLSAAAAIAVVATTAYVVGRASR